jgi:hypothetical protein
VQFALRFIEKLRFFYNGLDKTKIMLETFIQNISRLEGVLSYESIVDKWQFKKQWVYQYGIE